MLMALVVFCFHLYLSLSQQTNCTRVQRKSSFRALRGERCQHRGAGQQPELPFSHSHVDEEQQVRLKRFNKRGKTGMCFFVPGRCCFRSALSRSCKHVTCVVERQ
jgi:hypothetical protein